MKKRIGWFLAVVVLAGLLSGCSVFGDNGDGRIAGLETQVSQQGEWIEYQSTQIAHNQVIISYLATQIPAGQPGEGQPSAGGGISGSVQVHGGGCCVGGTAGDEINVDVQFEASSAHGQVTEMKVIVSQAELPAPDFSAEPWEAFTGEKVYPITLPNNWSAFWVYVQYRDVAGLVSEVYSDDVSVEGMPPQPSNTPNG